MLNADLVLVGDIGGTNTRLQLYEVAKIDRITDGAKAPGKLLFEQQYLNGDFSSFDAVVAAFMKAAKVTAAPASACFAVAGPVESNRVNFTNRDWVIDGAKLEASLGIAKVRLINDFVANGYGLLTLDEGKECVTLQGAPKVAGAPIACIGAGTGLGECFSTAVDQGAPYESYPSEGGHAEWCPRNALEVELLEFMKAKFHEKNRVSVERVISGPGLATMYEFYSGRFPEKVIREVHEAVQAAGEMKGKVISTHSKAGAAPYCELCALVMSTFAAAYGAEAGVAALKWIPLGGLYIAGGLTPKNLSLIEGASSPFMTAFHDKGRLTPLLKRVPVFAVLAEDIGQRGAHLVAFRLLLQVQAEAARLSQPMIGVMARGVEANAAGFQVNKLSWRGSYKRTIEICDGEIITKDPLTGAITNRWPRMNVLSVLPAADDVGMGVTMRVLGQAPPFLCGLAPAEQQLNFSVADEAQRDKLLKEITSMMVTTV